MDTAIAKSISIQFLCASLGRTNSPLLIDDPALANVAVIVCAPDTCMLVLAPEAPRLLAISLGHSGSYHDDHDMPERGTLAYDALYAWRSSARGETHNAALFAS